MEDINSLADVTIYDYKSLKKQLEDEYGNLKFLCKFIRIDKSFDYTLAKKEDGFEDEFLNYYITKESVTDNYVEAEMLQFHFYFIPRIVYNQNSSCIFSRFKIEFNEEGFKLYLLETKKGRIVPDIASQKYTYKEALDSKLLIIRTALIYLESLHNSLSSEVVFWSI